MKDCEDREIASHKLLSPKMQNSQHTEVNSQHTASDIRKFFNNTTSPTQILSNIRQDNVGSGTPPVKRTISQRSGSTSSTDSEVAHDQKRGNFNTSGDSFELNTPEALNAIENDDSVVEVKTSVLESLFTKLEHLQNQIDGIVISQNKILINQLGQDIKSDRVRVQLKGLKEDFKCEKIQLQ